MTSGTIPEQLTSAEIPSKFSIYDGCGAVLCGLLESMEYIGVNLVHQATHRHKRINALHILIVWPPTTEFTSMGIETTVPLIGLANSENESSPFFISVRMHHHRREYASLDRCRFFALKMQILRTTWVPAGGRFPFSSTRFSFIW